MVQVNGNSKTSDIEGADEKMVGNEEEEVLAPKNEVKFITGSQNPNGEAKIDIGSVEKVGCLFNRLAGLIGR